MFGYIANRMLIMIPTMLAISVLVFIIIQLPEGDFIETIISEKLSQGEAIDPSEIQALRELYGLDRSPIEQYFTWLFGLLRLRSANRRRKSVSRNSRAAKRRWTKSSRRSGRTWRL